jgi:glutathione S-transferase
MTDADDRHAILDAPEQVALESIHCPCFTTNTSRHQAVDPAGEQITDVTLSISHAPARLEGEKEEAMITCYAFASVPPFAQGLVRDLRVRWALEEAGLTYRAQLIGDRAGAISPAAYRAIQPFGQVPAIEDGDLTLFESGAIVLYVAAQKGDLLPEDPAARAQVLQWTFTALNTIEIPVEQLAEIDLFYAAERWAQERRPAAVDRVRTRLAELAAALDGREHFVGPFSAADILMTSVLRILRHTELLEEQPSLVAYKQRCEARPAFAKALADQMAAFAA